MAVLTQNNEHWLQHHNKVVLIDGLKYKLDISTHKAIYPYEHTVLSVYANPVSKNSKHYREVRAVLRDDWSTDILESDIEVQCNVLNQME